jgi:hypothetical protein
MCSPTVRCSLCGDDVSPDHWGAHRDVENFVLVEIRRLHPEWIERDGACRRCIRAYRLLGRARTTVRRAWRRASAAIAA